jgi:hypothetical protein
MCGSILTLIWTVLSRYFCNLILQPYRTCITVRTVPYLILTLQKVLQEAGVPTSATLVEARGLRGREDKTRPCDIVVLDFYAHGHHLMIDGVATIAYRNTRCYYYRNTVRNYRSYGVKT